MTRYTLADINHNGWLLDEPGVVTDHQFPVPEGSRLVMIGYDSFAEPYYRIEHPAAGGGFERCSCTDTAGHHDRGH